MFYGWAVVTGDEPHIPVAHPDSYFCNTWLNGTYELSFFVEMCFLPWHLTPMSGNRISIHGTNRNDVHYWRVRSGEVVFYAIVHFIPLQLQLRAPLFAQNRFVMYITRCIGTFVMYVTCYIYIISFLCEVMGATSPEEGKKKKCMIFYDLKKGKYMTLLCI